MTKKAWLSSFADTTLTTYKAWMADFSAALDDIGFPKSADTGQIDIPSVSAIPSNNVSGYEIRYLNDSLHAVAPVYVKIEYGVSNFPDRYGIAVTAGTGTDGAGTITGIFAPRYFFQPGYAVRTGVPLQSRACAVEGAAWIAYAEGMFASHNTIPSLFFGVFRTVDSAGVPTADGVAFYSMRNPQPYNFCPNTRSLRSVWVSANNLGASGLGGAGLYASTGLGITTSNTETGEKQLIPHILPFPELKVVGFAASTLGGDAIASGTEFSVALTGITPRNFVVSEAFRPPAQERFALIWE